MVRKPDCLRFVSAPLFRLSAEPRIRQTDDLRHAIEWERYKDLAAARQAAKKPKHPSVTYGEANRSRDRDMEETGGRPVTAPASLRNHPER